MYEKIKEPDDNEDIELKLLNDIRLKFFDLFLSQDWF